MARVKFGALVSSIDGSIGGHTLQRNAYGVTLKTKSRPRQYVTSHQMRTQLYMRKTLNAWQALTSADRKVWDQAVYFFNAKTKNNSASLLYGRDLYIKWNMVRLLSGLELESSISYLIPDWLGVEVSVKNIAGTLYFYTAAALVANSQHCLLRMSRPLLSTDQVVKNTARVCAFAYDAQSSHDVTSSYLDNFSALPEVGEYVDVWFSYLSVLAPYIYSEYYLRCKVLSE